MQPVPYLFFNGNCRAALDAYAKVFDSEPAQIFTAGEAPPDAGMPESARDMVMHGALKIGDGWIFASDDFAGNSPAMGGSSVMVSLPDVDRARAVFDALSDGGEVRMAFAAHFWTPGFGSLTDRFGTRWMIGTDGPEGQP